MDKHIYHLRISIDDTKNDINLDVIFIERAFQPIKNA